MTGQGDMTSVRILNVWTSKSPVDLIKAIQVVFFNGHTMTEGRLPDGKPDATFTFLAGEVLDGQLILSGNGQTGEWARASYLEFKTSKTKKFSAGRKFRAGFAHKTYSIDATGSLLSGFFGRAGQDVDQLGVVLFKPIKSLKITSVDYPTLDSVTSGLNPSAIVDRPYCNNGDRDQMEVRTVKVETGSKSVWNFSKTASFEASAGVEVEAGTPFVTGKAHADFKWDTSSTQSYTRESNTLDSVSEQFQITYQAHTMGRIQFTQFDSKIDVPWTGIEEITFKDNSSIKLNVHGIYNGVFVSKIMSNYQVTKCNPCVCDPELVEVGDGMFVVETAAEDNTPNSVQNKVEKRSGAVSQEFIDMFSEALSPNDEGN